MYTNQVIINAASREVPAAARKSTAGLVLLLPFAAAAAAGGAGFGLWSGDVAMAWLLVLGAVAVWVGVTLATGKRVSDIFAVFALAGLAGVALSVLCGGVVLPAIGAVIAGIARLGLSKIERRGWEHA